MKIWCSKTNGFVEAGAYVLMARYHTGRLEPFASYASVTGINAAIAELYEADANNVVCGGVPGGTHFYYVPVEAMP